MDKKPAAFLKKLEDTVAACNRCGYCTSYCPTYLATGSEAQSPRGRNQAFRALLEGKIKDPSEIKDIVDTCLLCGECTSICFSEVPTAQLMVHARHMINEKAGIPSFLKFVLQKVLPYPKRLRLTLKILFLGKRLGSATVYSSAPVSAAACGLDGTTVHATWISSGTMYLQPRVLP